MEGNFYGCDMGHMGSRVTLGQCVELVTNMGAVTVIQMRTRANLL